MIKEFKNWTEISKGYYLHAISSNVAYEIIVEYWDLVTPIETAKQLPDKCIEALDKWVDSLNEDNKDKQ